MQPSHHRAPPQPPPPGPRQQAAATRSAADDERLKALLLPAELPAFASRPLQGGPSTARQPATPSRAPPQPYSELRDAFFFYDSSPRDSSLTSWRSKDTTFFAPTHVSQPGAEFSRFLPTHRRPPTIDRAHPSPAIGSPPVAPPPALAAPPPGAKTPRSAEQDAQSECDVTEAPQAASARTASCPLPWRLRDQPPDGGTACAVRRVDER